LVAICCANDINRTNLKPIWLPINLKKAVFNAECGSITLINAF
jgi:hypothetical protein